jgi:hypothetical protein
MADIVAGLPLRLFNRRCRPASAVAKLARL